MASKTREAHYVLVPLMAQGHMLPMIDIAKLLGERGAIVSLVTTPYNAKRFQPSVTRAAFAAELPISVVQIAFPCEEVGLPLYCENLDILPSKNLLRNFYNGLSKLQEPLEEYLKTQRVPPTCIISDKCISWTSKTAQKFNIPRLVFHGMSCFSLLSSNNIKLHNAHNSVNGDSEPFMIPDLPHKIEITKAQLPGAFVKLPDLDDFREQMAEAESSAYGVVINSFEELENGFVERYKKATNKKVWCIGPVSLCRRETVDKFLRGNKPSIDENQCLNWLNSMKPRSAIYACLGSLCRLIAPQLIELGLSLEASNRPFIWVIKTGAEQLLEMEKWLSRERFEERTRERGLIIRGWAPQVLVLSHPAIGGFITHCGWNSTIEGVCSGVPMITWPLFAEQFFNEKFIVEILKIGVEVGAQVPVRWGEEEKVGVVVKRDGVEKAIVKLMDGGEEAEGRRRRAEELGAMARKSMEVGGSSYSNLSILMQDIIKQSNQWQ